MTWKKKPIAKRKPPRPSLRDRLAEDAERIAEEHRHLKRDFYERTAPKWGLAKGAT